MTLLPVETRVHVRGVAAERYPLNPMCSNPECDKAAAEPHHIWRRSEIIGDSWFVEIETDEDQEGEYLPDGSPVFGKLVVLPHVTGMCAGCHKNVTENRWWIKYEDGDFVLYEQVRDKLANWEKIGPLSPQPGGRDVPRRRPRKRKEGAERRERKRITLYVPADAEDLAGQFDDKIERVEKHFSNEGKHRSPIYTILAALDYVLLNEGDA